MENKTKTPKSVELTEKQRVNLNTWVTVQKTKGKAAELLGMNRTTLDRIQAKGTCSFENAELIKTTCRNAGKVKK